MSSNTSKSTNTSILSAEEIVPLDKIMSDIETKTDQKVAELMSPCQKLDTISKINYIQSQRVDFGKSLIGIMSAGADEFKEKTGRNMTYSEMRQM